MPHKCVEAIIGKLATDEGFRWRFLEDAVGALEELRKHAVELTPVEARRWPGRTGRSSAPSPAAPTSVCRRWI
jgi:hypothetical protein